METTEYEYIALAFKGGYRAKKPKIAPNIYGKQGHFVFLPVVKSEKSVEYNVKSKIRCYQSANFIPIHMGEHSSAYIGAIGFRFQTDAAPNHAKERMNRLTALASKSNPMKGRYP